MIVSSNENIHVNMNTGRDYEIALSDKDKTNISFILTSLANEPIWKLMLLRSKLEKAGSEIEQVHPLNFLRFVLTHEKHKTNLLKIQKSVFVGDAFLAGITRALDEESLRGNMRPEFIQDFSEETHASQKEVSSLVQEMRWKELIAKLLNTK